MARKTKTNSDMNNPYEQYKNTILWNILKDAIDQLKANKDIELTTNENHIIGFLCKSLDEKGLIPKT